MWKIPQGASFKVTANLEVVAALLRKKYKKRNDSVVRSKIQHLRAFWCCETQVINIQKVEAESSYCSSKKLSPKNL